MIAPDSVQARRAVPDDEPFIRQVFFAVRAPEFAPAGMSPEQLGLFLTQQYNAMRSYYAQEFPATVYWILESDGYPIGFEAVLDADELHLIDLALLPEARNQGIGTARMKRMQAMAANAGKDIILCVEIFNPAQRLYDRLGFQVEGEQGLYRTMRWSPGLASGASHD